MKLPSLSILVDTTVSTFIRFSTAILAAIIGSVFAILLAHLNYSQTESHHWYWNVVMSSYLGMLLFIAIKAFTESMVLSPIMSISLQVVGIALTIAFYFSLPNEFMVVSTIRYVLFALALHWLIAFIPFTAHGNMNAFWQYNKIIFLRILMTLLYTIVLYCGLSLALLAMEKLFSLHIDSKLYLDLWIVLTGVFNTWFFLAGFPKGFNLLEQNTDYPKGLKIFTQYVLLPIITIYLFILYAYLFKILFTMQWPVGWVSYLVLGFSVAGILSLLLIHPIRFEINNKWIPTFSRFFYYALFPLLVLLLFAIQRRISDYGITELRYFVLLLALWLFFIVIYFSISKQKSIKIIPMSLCLLAFLAAYGPLSAFSVTIKSQKNVLSHLLAKNNLLVNGKLIKATKEPSFKDRKQISSIIDYLSKTHGYQTLQPYFAISLDSLVKHDSTIISNYNHDVTERLMELLNIKYEYQYATEENEETNFEFSAKISGTMQMIKGYDFLISGSNFSEYGNDTSQRYNSYYFEKDTVHMCFNPIKSNLDITINHEKAIVLNMDSILNKIISKNGLGHKQLPDSNMTFLVDSPTNQWLITLTNISGSTKGKKNLINYLSANFLIKKGK